MGEIGLNVSVGSYLCGEFGNSVVMPLIADIGRLIVEKLGELECKLRRCSDE